MKGEKRRMKGGKGIEETSMMITLRGGKGHQSLYRAHLRQGIGMRANSPQYEI
jgi:hypothetical protein